MIGEHFAKDAAILDFGCSAGANVHTLVDAGYSKTVGYEIRDYLELRDEADRSRFYITSDARLPFDDNTFDLVFSDEVFEHVQDQVTVFNELHRITKLGGHHMHAIPARYHVLEPHIWVPFGGILGHRWWFKLWAMLGVRNRFQKGLSANETADMNAYYWVSALNYVPTSCYKVVWRELGFTYKFSEQEFFSTHRRATVRALGKLNQVVPVFGWLYRTFKARHVFLIKDRPPCELLNNGGHESMYPA